MILITKTLVTF